VETNPRAAKTSGDGNDVRAFSDLPKNPVMLCRAGRVERTKAVTSALAIEAAAHGEVSPEGSRKTTAEF
jgi:DNA-binding transcriptional regulator YdaS (Cro superfamily)